MAKKRLLLLVIWMWSFLAFAFMVEATFAVQGFCDFTSERCADLEKNLPLLQEKYKYDIITEKHYYNPDRGEEIVLPLLAMECAKRQGDKERYLRILLENRGKVKRDDLKGYAVQLGLSASNFSMCLDTRMTEKKVKQILDDIESKGIRAVPTVVVKGENYEGVVLFSNLEEIIQEKLGLKTEGNKKELEKEQQAWQKEQEEAAKKVAAMSIQEEIKPKESEEEEQGNPEEGLQQKQQDEEQGRAEKLLEQQEPLPQEPLFVRMMRRIFTFFAEMRRK